MIGTIDRSESSLLTKKLRITIDRPMIGGLATEEEEEDEDHHIIQDIEAEIPKEETTEEGDADPVITTPITPNPTNRTNSEPTSTCKYVQKI